MFNGIIKYLRQIKGFIINTTPHISIVTPVYGCAKSLEKLYLRLNNTLTKITENFEIIMINDASPDDAWLQIKKLASKDSLVKGLNLSRNFGQHYAITAGLDISQGEWVVVMDCDLQDQPQEILKLYSKVQEGFDVVWGKRYQRKDTYLKQLGSKIFYKIYDYFTEKKTDSSIANFSIISKQVVKEFKQIKEQNRNFPLFIEWLGFNVAQIDINHAQREDGKSAYTLKKLINFAIDSIVSQSNRPLRLSIKLGFIISFSSIIYTLYLTFRYFIHGVPVEGWTSVMVSIYFIGGLLFANLGFVGLYIGKIFDETKERPLYIIKDKINC